MSFNIILLLLSNFIVIYGFDIRGMKVIDLSHDLNNNTIHWPTGIPFQLFVKHKGLVMPGQKEDENNFWYEMNDFATSEHSGTHLDAPVHFGRNRWSVDQIPPDRFIGSVSIVDLRDHVKANADFEITADDLKEWESKQGKNLDELVILWTGWASRWQNKESYLGSSSNNTFLLRFPGLHPSAAQWLVENRNLNGIGIDTPSIDFGQSKTYKSHRILASRNIFMLENVNTLPLDSTVFVNPFLIVSPLKITAGSGSPVRALLLDLSSKTISFSVVKTPSVIVTLLSLILVLKCFN